MDIEITIVIKRGKNLTVLDGFKYRKCIIVEIRFSGVKYCTRTKIIRRRQMTHVLKSDFYNLKNQNFS